MSGGVCVLWVQLIYTMHRTHIARVTTASTWRRDSWLLTVMKTNLLMNIGAVRSVTWHNVCTVGGANATRHVLQNATLLTILANEQGAPSFIPSCFSVARARALDCRFTQGCICQIFTGGGVRVSTGYDWPTVQSLQRRLRGNAACPLPQNFSCT